MEKHIIKRLDKNTIEFDGKIYHSFYCDNRVVFHIEELDIVVKMDTLKQRSSGGCHMLSLQCRNEKLKWRTLRKSTYAKHFAPILDGGIVDGYHYVIMPYFQTLRDLGYMGCGKEIPDWACNQIKEIAKTCDISDTHTGNWTIVNDEYVVLFDYAIGAKDW